MTPRVDYRLIHMILNYLKRLLHRSGSDFVPPEFPDLRNVTSPVSGPKLTLEERRALYKQMCEMKAQWEKQGVHLTLFDNLEDLVPEDIPEVPGYQ